MYLSLAVLVLLNVCWSALSSQCTFVSALLLGQEELLGEGIIFINHTPIAPTQLRPGHHTPQPMDTPRFY